MYACLRPGGQLPLTPGRKADLRTDLITSGQFGDARIGAAGDQMRAQLAKSELRFDVPKGGVQFLDEIIVAEARHCTQLRETRSQPAQDAGRFVPRIH